MGTTFLSVILLSIGLYLPILVTTRFHNQLSWSGNIRQPLKLLPDVSGAWWISHHAFHIQSKAFQQMHRVVNAARGLLLTKQPEASVCRRLHHPVCAAHADVYPTMTSPHGAFWRASCHGCVTKYSCIATTPKSLIIPLVFSSPSGRWYCKHPRVTYYIADESCA